MIFHQKTCATRFCMKTKLEPFSLIGSIYWNKGDNRLIRLQDTTLCFGGKICCLFVVSSLFFVSFCRGVTTVSASQVWYTKTNVIRNHMSVENLWFVFAFEYVEFLLMYSLASLFFDFIFHMFASSPFEETCFLL